MRKWIAMLLVMLLVLIGLAVAENSAIAEETEAVEWLSSLPVLSEEELAWLIIANHDQPLAEDYVPEDITTVTKRLNDGYGVRQNTGIAMATTVKVQLNRTVISAVGKMFDDAERNGIDLYLRLGYRSYKEQDRLYKRANGGDYVQAAGEADWQTGLAVGVVNFDWRGQVLNGDFGSTAEAQWLIENAARFGFVLRYPKGKEDITGNKYEPWHLRYVGSSKVAGYMTRNNLTLEEFVAQYEEARTEFINRGGSMEQLLEEQDLPDGPIVLSTPAEDGDFDIILFHD